MPLNSLPGLLLLFIGAITLGVWGAINSAPITQKQSVEWLQQQRPVTSFALTSSTGDFGLAQLNNHWSLLLMGYMHCPDICPTSLAQLSKLQQQLNDLALQGVFISIDPKRDKPQQLADYVHYFNPEFHGVTGTIEQLQQLSQSLGTQFSESENNTDYLLAHSISTAIINPQGEFVGRLRPGFDVNASATELRRYINQYSTSAP